MEKIDLILQKLDSLEAGQKSLEIGQQSLVAGQKSLEIGQQELNQIVSATLHRQDETDAKLESIAMDVHKIHGRSEETARELSLFHKETLEKSRRFERHSKAIEKDLDRTITRVEVLESRSGS